MATIAATALAPAPFKQPSSATSLSYLRSQSHGRRPFRFASTPHRTATLSASLKSPPAASQNDVASLGATYQKSRKSEPPIVVIDNYDSFTYNLCQYIGETPYEVYRNDEITIDDLKKKNPRAILISPGPGTPQDSGISLQAVLEFGPTIPVIGVCMGLQCIAEAFGGKIVRSTNGVMHGKISLVYRNNDCEVTSLLDGLPNPFTAGRYHSLVIEKESFPDVLEITAWTEDGQIMGACHKIYKHIQGVQFHPESLLTTEGKKIMLNFERVIRARETLSDPHYLC